MHRISLFVLERIVTGAPSWRKAIDLIAAPEQMAE
jgi:hypothetical protein